MRISKALPSLIGKRYELSAEKYLKSAGLKVVARNFRCRSGEIDLVMRDGNQITFVEVRYRNNTDYGSALESIDWRKQQRLIVAAKYFLAKHPKLQQYSCRFDALGLTEIDGEVHYDWVKDAFST